MIVAAVGVSTITAGWHRLADVVGAILIALAWARSSPRSSFAPRAGCPADLGHGARRLDHSARGLAGAGVIIAGIVGLVVAAFDPARLGDAAAAGGSEPRTFVAALVVTLGSALVAFALYEWAMRGVALEAPP